VSYSESNGIVTLKMSREDYKRFLIVCQVVCGTSQTIIPETSAQEWADRLNEGNPNWTLLQRKESQ
jgi:hypothetical protein